MAWAEGEMWVGDEDKVVPSGAVVGLQVIVRNLTFTLSAIRSLVKYL